MQRNKVTAFISTHKKKGGRQKSALQQPDEKQEDYV